jgi:hypothetical protein
MNATNYVSDRIEPEKGFERCRKVSDAMTINQTIDTCFGPGRMEKSASSR